jgi:alpha-ribazole phosphatase/probable phosphoglycerate mutase
VSRLVLLRHAEPEEDSRGRCYGSLDVGLSPAGLEHAKRLARDLAALPLDAVYSSPRRRALDTAAQIATVHGLATEVDDRLRELDFGILEGRRYEEIERSEPELFRAWMETPTEASFPGGESYDDLRLRAVAACDEIRGCHGCALVVTHGGVVRAVVSECLAIPAAAIFRLDQSYGGVTIVDWIEGTPIVRVLNGATPPDR